jgi:hypothetical protein
MPPHFSSPPPGRRASETKAEFAEAAARMFAKRANATTLDGRAETPPPLDHAEVWEDPSSSFWNRLRSGPILSRALLLAPLVVVGFIIVWMFRPEPQQPAPPLSASPVPASSVPAKRVEQKAELREPPVAARVPASSPPVRQEVVEAKPVKVPEPVVPAVAAEAPATPLSSDEIKLLQGKLGALGFGPGPIDGVVGPQTQAALRRYAQSRGLANPDATRSLLSRLEAERPKR